MNATLTTSTTRSGDPVAYYDRCPRRAVSTSHGRMNCLDTGGDAEAVVLVHGSPTSSFTFRHQIAALAGDYRVIAPDLLCFGASEGPPGGADFTLQAQALGELLEQLEPQSFHLLAHDWGGPIAVSAVAGRPEALRSLTLVNTTIRPDWRPGGAWRAFSTAGLDELLIVRLNSFARGLPLQMRAARDPVVWARYASRLRGLETRRTVLALERLQGFEAQCRTAAAALSRLPERQLVIWGDYDFTFDRVARERLLDYLPHARLLRLPGATHFAHEDAPGRFTAGLRSFLAAEEPA